MIAVKGFEALFGGEDEEDVRDYSLDYFVTLFVIRARDIYDICYAIT